MRDHRDDFWDILVVLATVLAVMMGALAIKAWWA